MQTLADRLKQARESVGKGQKEIAASVDVSYRAWQGYETGENQPGAKVIEGLVRLGFNANWLLTGEGEMQRGIPVELEAETDTGIVRVRGTMAEPPPLDNSLLEKALKMVRNLAKAAPLPPDKEAELLGQAYAEFYEMKYHHEKDGEG